jgi:hypothetical protein
VVEDTAVVVVVVEDLAVVEVVEAAEARVAVVVELIDTLVPVDDAAAPPGDVVLELAEPQMKAGSL